MNPPSFSFAGRPNLTPEDVLRLFPDHWVQYFDDSPLHDRRKAMATPQFDLQEALRKQKAGCGVFFSPNAFDGVRRIENLLRIQAAYVDIDIRREGEGMSADEFQKRLASGLAALQGFSLPPHVVIRTKNGLQAIWRTEPLTPGEGLPLFRETEDRLIAHFRADPAAKDVTRVLRLPGFLHLKDPGSPFLCDLIHIDPSGDPYPLADLLAAIPAPEASSQVKPVQAPGALRRGNKRWEAACDGVAEGGRNAAAASVAGKLLAGLPTECWDTDGWARLKAWNDLNRPPLPEGELRSVFESISRREAGRRGAGARDGDDGGTRSQADKLVALATREGAQFFLDQLGRPYASVPVEDHRETWAIRSRPMRMWLSSLLWRSEAHAPGKNALVAASTVLESRAYFGSRHVSLHNRVAWHDGALWYDLTNECWEAVRVTAQGWEVVKNPPVLFQRYAHAEPQCLPKAGGDVRAFLRFTNVRDPHQQTLLLVYLVSCFLPDIPHPVAVVHGPQGSAKTTLGRMLRRLIDPSFVHVAALPQSVPGLVQKLSHNWFTCFDNVSELPDWASDTLCRAVTGEGFSKRELFTDDEDILYAFRRCVALNGINVAARKADLLDRSLLFRLGCVGAVDRRSERALWAEFEQSRPALLGGVFDALSGAIRRHPLVRLASAPRMADFAEWGEAIAGALGLVPETFHAACRSNQRERQEEAIDQSPAAWAFAAFMHDRETWDGSPAELLKCLGALAGRERVNTKSAGWPGMPSTLMRRLNEARGSLADAGITFESHRVGKGRRLVRAKRTGDAGDAAASPPAAVPSDGVAGDGRPAGGGGTES